VRIIETEQISTECLAKYITQKYLKNVSESSIPFVQSLEITKITTRVYENEKLCGIYKIIF